jgi:serine/threonine-protein kinase
MAPEQAAADPFIDHRADIYSVGVLAYEMLAGRPPFVGSPPAVLSAQIASAPPPLGQVKPDVPPAIAQIVMKCLEKEPAKRYQTADELLVAIESLVTPSGMAPPPQETRRKRVAQLVMGAAALVVIVAGAIFATGRMRRDRWVHQTALPELRPDRGGENDSAFDSALRIQAAAPTTARSSLGRRSRARSSFVRIRGA